MIRRQTILLIALIIVGCDSCTDEKVDTDEASKSDKMFKLLKNIAKDELGISKVDCSQRCENSFDYLDWNRQTKGLTIPIQIVK